jgi:hypothetical protein|tara:strand:- start:3133 stop:3531 length:399 start_codon:yes stop_codon:yes gene_type:complete
MILGKTQKIMKTGIAKYSKEFEITKDNTQILITAQEKDGALTFRMCNCWSPKQRVGFKDIMDVRVDMLGFEMMASPFLSKSVEMYAKYYDVLVKEINLFIFEKNDKVGVAVYENKKFKEAVSLEKQFERLGL